MKTFERLMVCASPLACAFFLTAPGLNAAAGTAVISASASMLTVENATTYDAHVSLYEVRFGTGLSASTVLPPNGRARWALEGPRAIKVRVINVSIGDKNTRYCGISEETKGEPGDWVVTYENKRCELRRH